MKTTLRAGARRLSMTLVLVLSLLLVLAGSALAHVKVNPDKAVVNAYQEYNVRVPNEGKTATNKVEISLPADLTFSSVQPKTGWTYELKKDAAQKVVGIVWTGGEIKVGEYDTFNFQAKNPAKPGTLTFPAIQTYADGTVVNWTGAPGADKPAPTVDIQAADAPATTPAPSTTPTTPAPAVTPAAPPAPAPTAGSSNLPTILGGGALLLSLIALGVTLFKK